MMFKGEDCQALQTLTDNGTITPEHQKTPSKSPRCHTYNRPAVVAAEAHPETTCRQRDPPTMPRHSLAPINEEPLINEKEHFWHYHSEILLDLWQKSDEDIHSLSNNINNAKFTHWETKEILKIMLLQLAVCFIKAHDLTHQQNLQELTYSTILSHYKLIKSWCKWY